MENRQELQQFSGWSKSDDISMNGKLAAAFLER